jgi:hypothetical protein
MPNEAKTTGGSLSAVVDAPPSPSFRARPALWIAMIATSTAICAVAIMIGTHKFHLGPAAIVLMPILWTVLIGGFLGVQRWKPIEGVPCRVHASDGRVHRFLPGRPRHSDWPVADEIQNIGRSSCRRWAT